MKPAKTLQALRGDRAANEHFISNDDECYRDGAAILAASVELMVNQVISKRTVKQQLLRWTKLGG